MSQIRGGGDDAGHSRVSDGVVELDEVNLLGPEDALELLVAGVGVVGQTYIWVLPKSFHRRSVVSWVRQSVRLWIWMRSILGQWISDNDIASGNTPCSNPVVQTLVA